MTNLVLVPNPSGNIGTINNQLYFPYSEELGSDTTIYCLVYHFEDNSIITDEKLINEFIKQYNN